MNVQNCKYIDIHNRNEETGNRTFLVIVVTVSKNIVLRKTSLMLKILKKIP